MFAVDVDLSDARGLTCRFDIFFFRELEGPGLLQKILLKKKVHARLIQQNKAERRQGKVG